MFEAIEGAYSRYTRLNSAVSTVSQERCQKPAKGTCDALDLFAFFRKEEPKPSSLSKNKEEEIRAYIKQKRAEPTKPENRITTVEAAQAAIRKRKEERQEMLDKLDQLAKKAEEWRKNRED